MPTQREKAELLRQLHHRPDPLLLPNAWDAVSAKLFEAAGFPAIATTSAGIANLLGYPDGQRAPADLLLAIAGRIAASVQVPVSADLESGYGTDIPAVLRTVERALHLGIAGANIEDSRPDKSFVPLAEQAALLRAIRRHADHLGIPLVLNARVDLFLHPGDPAAQLREAIDRANAYLDAGADSVFPIAAKDPAAIAELVRSIRGPVNILLTAATPAIPDLHALGVRRITFAAGLMRAGFPALRKRARDLRTKNTCDDLFQSEFTGASVNSMFTTA
ncbi:MAG: isocitrate lyase/PEP mutase family protein [Phycisphaerae bacterium]